LTIVGVPLEGKGYGNAMIRGGRSNQVGMRRTGPEKYSGKDRYGEMGAFLVCRRGKR
jgi:hypothetical protein